jgi:hypothetical protein
MHRVDWTADGESFSVITDAGAAEALAMFEAAQELAAKRLARAMLVRMGEACNAMCAASKAMEAIVGGEDEG